MLEEGRSTTIRNGPTPGRRWTVRWDDGGDSPVMPVDLIDGTFTVPPEAIADYLSRRER